MTDPLTFTISPFQLGQFRDSLDALTDRFTNYWAGVQMPMRLISRTRRFSFAPLRQSLRRDLLPLDDVRDALALVHAGDDSALIQLVHDRLASLTRAISPLPDGRDLATALQHLAGGSLGPLPQVQDGWERALWRWRWLKNYMRSYSVLERDGMPLSIDHYLIAWPEEHTNAAALQSVLKQTFQLPGVTATPLPSLFSGQYAEEATALRPMQDGDPWLRVLHAYDIRGTWDLTSWVELLMGQHELALCIDVQTLPRAKALRATTNAFGSLRVALGTNNAPKDARSERAFGDVEYAMQALDHQGLHEVAYAILIQAPTLRALEEQTQALRGQWGARLQLDVLAGAQADLLTLFTTAPARDVTAPLIRRNSLSANVAVKTPWGIRKSRDIHGSMWGYDPFEQLPIHKDLFGVSGTDNAHLVCLASPGGGKTVVLSTLALRQAVAGHQVVYFDPVGKVKWICEAVGRDAAYYDVAGDSAINILDPQSTDMARQLEHVTRRLSMILGRTQEGGGTIGFLARELSNFELGALDLALQSERIYGPQGVYLAQMSDETSPLLADLIAALRAVPVAEAPSLAREIELMCLGSKAHLYNARTTLKWDFTAAMNGYNFQTAPKARWPLILDHGYGALNTYIRSPQRRARKQKLVCVTDEYGVMTKVESLKAEIAYNTREWRNYGAANWIADQTIQTLMGSGTASDYGQITLTTSAIKLLGRQEGHDAEQLAQTYGDLLSPSDIAAIRTAAPGEFIAIFGNEVHHLRVQLTDLEYPLFVRPDTAAKEV